MIRFSRCIAVVLTLAPSAVAQSLASREMLRPITSRVKDAGVYHLGLGTWTRHVDTANAILSDVIYANTCPTGYYLGQFTNEFFVDDGRVPGPNGPVVCDSPGLLSTNKGCQCSYDISGFQIGYCSGIPGFSPISVNIGFQGAHTACAVSSVIPGSPGTFDLTGLPGAGASIQGCWLVNIDLTAASQSFVLPADGASCTWLASGDLATNHLFGWTFQNKTSVTGVGNDNIGPLIAGNGGPLAPSPACSMVDSTRWDTLFCPGQGGGRDRYPNNLTEDGWGMDTQDRFRDDTTNSTGGPVQSGAGPGCHFFGGNPVASFHLKLYAITGCCRECVNPSICRPGIDFTTPSCPCSNQPTTPNAGCNALSPPGPGTPTGGALMTANGNAVPYDAGTDTLNTTVSGLPTAASESAYLLQGTTVIAPLVFGQGLRCCGGALKRMQIHTAPGTGTSTWPAAGDLFTTISERSNNAPGAIVHILPGQSYCYFIQYRQSLFGAGCALPSNFNASNGQLITWHLP